MTNRDDFSAPVKRAIALRAAYRCSFSGCNRLTIGPSEESPSASACVGVAAHIHAASPGQGARRYLEAMTSEERSDIDNAIWMCATHATLIDRDETTYTANSLREMKSAHERAIAAELAGTGSFAETLSLIALGTEIVAAGEVVGTNVSKWTIRLDHFVYGGPNFLIRMSEHFDELSRDERYVLVNTLGDGRVLSRAPVWRKENGKIYVSVTVEHRFPRISAQALKRDLKLVNGDISLEKGNIASVSGVDALPQKIQLCLWHQKGGTPFSQRFGSRIGEYYSLFGRSPWFEQLVKLETIRLAAIPYGDIDEEYTPFQCVEQVKFIRLLTPQPEDRWLPARIGLEVNGLDTWEQDIRLFVPEWPTNNLIASATTLRSHA